MQQEFIAVERQPKGWLALFQQLHFKARANAGSQSVAKNPMNVIRNRYRDVLPIDDTRVTIDDEANDYINANFVEVTDVKRKYILTQGPLQHTVSHFWQMVWEQKTVGVVMLNKCLERGIIKCFPYWPQVEDEPLQAGQFRVENLGSEDESCYRLTHLKLENLNTQESRMILHFNYTRWPDFGVPQTANVFLEFLYAVRSAGVLSEDVGPCVVHCSAGIGRSGTFCLVDVCLKMVEQSREIAGLDVQGVLLDMRRQRLGLIQTPDQLRFSYIAILQGAANILGLEKVAGPAPESDEEEEEEEEEEEDSESDELEDEPTEPRYRFLSNPYRNQLEDDLPPPVPPRPPETFQQQELPPPPPPPPTSLPPGPPVTHPLDRPTHERERSLEEEGQDELLVKKRKLDDGEGKEGEEEVAEYGFSLRKGGLQNGTVLEDIESEEEEEKGEGEEEEEDEEEEKPPPIPPRSNSLSPEYLRPLQRTEVLSGGGGAETSQNATRSRADHFLYNVGGGGGRGGGGGGGERGSSSGESSAPPSPPLPPLPLPPSVPSRAGPPPSAKGDNTAAREEGTASHTKDQESTEPPSSGNGTELRNREHRGERNARLSGMVQSMKDNLREHEEHIGGSTSSNLSVPWLLVGFGAIVGYCLFYVFYGS